MFTLHVIGTVQLLTAERFGSKSDAKSWGLQNIAGSFEIRSGFDLNGRGRIVAGVY